jgi:hypothetical protein
MKGYAKSTFLFEKVAKSFAEKISNDILKLGHLAANVYNVLFSLQNYTM